MTIAWATIKTTVADEIAQAMATAVAGDFAAFPAPAVPLSATYTWAGTSTVLTSDTSEVSDSPSSFIKLDSDGVWYRVTGIVPNTSVTVEDTYGVGSFPSGSTQSSRAAGGLPSAPDASTFQARLAVPIANAVVDGIKDALDQAVINDVADDPGNTVGPGVIV